MLRALRCAELRRELRRRAACRPEGSGRQRRRVGGVGPSAPSAGAPHVDVLPAVCPCYELAGSDRGGDWGGTQVMETAGARPWGACSLQEAWQWDEGDAGIAQGDAGALQMGCALPPPLGTSRLAAFSVLTRARVCVACCS